MRVLKVTDSSKLDGGITQIAVTATNGLIRRGAEVQYVAATGPPTDKFMDSNRLRVTCFGQQDILADPHRLRAMASGIVNTRSLRELSKILRNYSDDGETIVHIYGWYKALSPAVVSQVVECGLPCIVTVQEYYMGCPNGAFYDYSANAICHRLPLSISCISCNCDSRSYPIKLWRVARFAVQKYWYDVPGSVPAFLLASRFSHKILEPFLPKRGTVHFLDNPIEVSDNGRATVEENGNYFFVGRISREKGVMHFLEAARRCGVNAVVGGAGPLLEEAKAAYPEATYLGWLSSEDVSNWMRKARCIVFPSTWYEGQPLVPIEAAANGVPSIISDCTAAVDYLPEETHSLHFKQANVESLCERITQMQSPALAKYLSETVYQWYWANPWTVERHVDGLEQVYRRVIHEHRSRSESGKRVEISS